MKSQLVLATLILEVSWLLVEICAIPMEVYSVNSWPRLGNMGHTFDLTSGLLDPYSRPNLPHNPWHLGDSPSPGTGVFIPERKSKVSTLEDNVVIPSVPVGYGTGFFQFPSASKDLVAPPYGKSLMASKRPHVTLPKNLEQYHGRQKSIIPGNSTPGSPSTSPDALYKSAPRLHEPKKLLRSASWRAPKKEATMKSREKPQTFAIPPAQTSYETEFPRLSILNSAMPHDTSVKVPDVRGSNGDQPMRNSLGVWDQESKAPSESSAAKDETIPLKTDASAEVHDKIGENVGKDLIGGQLWDIINRFGPKESTPDSSVVLH